MVFRILLFLCALSSLSVPVQASFWDSVTGFFREAEPTEPPTIKVLVAHDRPGVVLEVKGKYKIYDPNTNEYISTRYVGKRKFIQAVKDGLKWGEEFPGIYQLTIVPDEKRTTTIVDGIEYEGPIYVYDIGGAISVVNQIKIEAFISSILAQKYRHMHYHDEALAAMAIVARTSAFYRSQNPRSQYWAVDAQQAGYQGSAAVVDGSPIEKAIRATRYMVMSFSQTAEEPILPFLAEWSHPGKENPKINQVAFALITPDKANEMADRGMHAAQILEKAFPGITIRLIHKLEEPAKK